jgi:hypothetical protein
MRRRLDFLNYVKIVDAIEGYNYRVGMICKKEQYSSVLLIFNTHKRLIAEYCCVNQHIMFKNKKTNIQYNEELIVWRR